MDINLKAAAATAGAVLTLAGAGKGGYETYREYEKQAINIRVLQCQVAELRNVQMKRAKLGWECHKIALEYAGMLPSRPAPASHP